MRSLIGEAEDTYSHAIENDGLKDFFTGPVTDHERVVE